MFNRNVPEGLFQPQILFTPIIFNLGSLVLRYYEDRRRKTMGKKEVKTKGGKWAAGEEEKRNQSSKAF